MFRKILLLIFSIPLSAFGSSLILQANLGAGAWDAVSKCASSVFQVKIGTFGIIMNIILIFAQMLILRKNFKPLQLLQFAMAIILGNLVNFFYYDFQIVQISDVYFQRLLICCIGIVINAAAVAMMIKLNILTFPVAGFVKAISDYVKKSYGLCRQCLDLFCIALVFVLVFCFQGEMTLREGTCINMLLFGPLVDVFIKGYSLLERKG